MAAPDFEHRPGERLRLATQSKPCSARSMAIAALDRSAIPWTEIFGGAATSPGLAVAALGRRVFPPGTVDVGPRLGLPELPTRDVMLLARLSDSPGAPLAQDTLRCDPVDGHVNSDERRFLDSPVVRGARPDEAGCVRRPSPSRFGES